MLVSKIFSVSQKFKTIEASIGIVFAACALKVFAAFDYKISCWSFIDAMYLARDAKKRQVYNQLQEITIYGVLLIEIDIDRIC